jgi:hypothetical protein
VHIPRPIAYRNKQPSLRTLAFGLALLATCIFAWGLSYKLSLYDPPHAVSRHMPAAKLLSGKDRNAVPLVAAPLAAHLPATSFVPLAFGTLALALLTFTGSRFVPGAGNSLLSSRPLRIAPACVPSAASFIRPPPRRR